MASCFRYIGCRCRCRGGEGRQGGRKGPDQTADTAGLNDCLPEVTVDFQLNALAASAAVAQVGRMTAGELPACAAAGPESRLLQKALKDAPPFSVAAPDADGGIRPGAAVKCKNPRGPARHAPGHRLIEPMAGNMQVPVAARLQTDKAVESVPSAGQNRGQRVGSRLDAAPVRGHDEQARAPRTGQYTVVAHPLFVARQVTKRVVGHRQCLPRL